MKIFPLLSVFFPLLFSGLFSNITAQTTVTIGSPDFPSSDFGVEGPYNWQQTTLRSQILITATELNALGLGEGQILSFAMNKSNQGVSGTLEGFIVSGGVLNGDFGVQFETGLSVLVASQDFTPQFGWNEHVFDSPFNWDGSSDIVFETCYQNGGPGDFPNEMWFSFEGQQYYKESDHLGPNSACDDNFAEDLFAFHPQLQLTWLPPQLPPIADINILSAAACSGYLSLSDNSNYSPESWLWYFGDGSTSTDENPEHTYSMDGTYTVSLVVTNEFGTDSTAVVNAITVTLASNPPLPAMCIPETQNLSAGFGVVNVTLNGNSYPSSNGSVGYEDLTCSNFEVNQGVIYTLEVEVDGPSDNHVVTWIDFNADGSFSDDEKIMTQVTDQLASVDFMVPATALTDSTLRMRVIADFFLLGESSSCSNPSGGQAEDHAIRITPNTAPPTAGFSFAPTFSCDGIIQFQDESLSTPTSWLWQFGDSEFSTAQSPSHTYTTSGTYTVSLSVQNSFGTDFLELTDVITIDIEQALIPTCEPPTQSYCCGYGLVSFEFGGIANLSADGSAGYEDFSCGQEASVTEGMTYSISADTGTENPHDLKIYIDLNNDGDLTIDEIVFTSFNSYQHTGTITIPATVPLEETRIRMRVLADFVGNSNTACTQPQFGQVEDYSVVIYPDTTPPTTAFTASPLLSCDGEVTFTNNSELGSSYLWYFGDSNTSIDESPTHTYTSNGTYTVSLVTTNDYGSDSLAIVDYVTVDFVGVCDTISLPTSGIGAVLTDCNGYLTDDGGPEGVYSNDSESSVTIMTGPGNIIFLSFIAFNFQTNNDYLLIYDGANTDAPLIGQYSGTSLPSGGTILSSGNSITIQQMTNFFGQNDGFLLEWSCSPVGLEELSSEHLRLWPNPSNDIVHIDYPYDFIVTQLIVRDMTGKQLDAYPTYSKDLDISALSPGNYLLEIRSDHQKIHKLFTVR